MTLTRKHFRAVAKILNELYKENNSPKNRILIRILTNEFSDYFETENPAFDRERFKKAVFEGVV